MLQKAWKGIKQTKRNLQEFWLITVPLSQNSWRFFVLAFLVAFHAFCNIRIGIFVLFGTVP